MTHFTSVRQPPASAFICTGVVAALLQDMRNMTPGRAALCFLHRIAPLEYLSLVEYRAGDLPRQLEGHSVSRRCQDTTARCFALYRGRFDRYDEATGLAKGLVREDPQEPHVDVLHYPQHDIPNREWRETIFERERLAGRVSFLFAGGADTAFAVNVYRDVDVGAFSGDEVRRFAEVAPVLQLAMLPRLEETRPAPMDKRIARAESRLAERAPQLTGRERQVAARIACGLSNDGTAADLGVSPSTITTLRKRVYAKLHVNSRLDLVSLLR
jgi:DNA-binding CsgD family transcriptional regulator